MVTTKSKTTSATVSRFVRAAAVSAAAFFGASSAANAATVYAEVTADNYVAVSYGTASSMSAPVPASNTTNWRGMSQFKFQIPDHILADCSCAVQVVAWGDGSVAEGLFGYFKWAEGGNTVYTGDPRITAKNTGVNAGGNPNANLTPGMLASWRSSPGAPAPSAIVGNGQNSHPWLVNFGSQFNGSRWIWSDANFAQQGSDRNFRSFEVPCSAIVSKGGYSAPEANKVRLHRPSPSRIIKLPRLQ